jgi:hypothetical protein
MVELIQLVDESLARYGLGTLLRVGRECRETPLEPCLGLRHLPEFQDPSGPNWANARSDGRD